MTAPAVTTQDVVGLAVAVLPAAISAIEGALGGVVPVALASEAITSVLGALAVVVEDAVAGKDWTQIRRDLDDKIVDIVETAKVGAAKT